MPCSHENAVLLGKDVKVDGHDIMAIGEHLRCKKSHSLCVGGEIYVPKKTVGTDAAHCHMDSHLRNIRTTLTQ